MSFALPHNIKFVVVGDEEITWPHDSKGQFTVKKFCRQAC